MKIIKTSTNSGLIYHGLLSQPINNDFETIIIHIHGMAGSCVNEDYYPVMHEYYEKNNITFLAVEHRGSGSITNFETTKGVSRVIGNTYEIFEDCVEDIQAWVDDVIGLGYKKIWLQAHSLGPSKVVYYLNEVNPTNIAGLVLISPAEMIGLVHDPIGQREFDILYPEAVKLINDDKGNQILSIKLWEYATLSANTFINLFADGSKAAVFNYANPTLGFNAVNNVRVPVLAITGTEDDGIEPVMSPANAMTILEKELMNSPRVKTIVYENAQHSFEGFEQKIVEDVVKFIRN